MDSQGLLHAISKLPDPQHPSTQIARSAAAEIERLRAGLERLQLPLAFHLPGKTDPEHRARMFYAHAILNGETAERAEEIAAENVRRASHKTEPKT